MPANKVLLERVELSSTASSVSISNIPQTGYTDLVLKVSGRTTLSGDHDLGYIQFNSASTNLSFRRLQGDANVVSTTNGTGGIYFRASGNTAQSNLYGHAELKILNYTASQSKSVLVDSAAEYDGVTGYISLYAGLWSSNSAITSIQIYPNNGVWMAGSSFSLYGVADASTTPAIAPKATGGNIIATDGTYWYHAFLTSGAFIPQVSLSCDYLVIGGGGGGGGDVGGGGGAGGLRSTVSATGGGGSLESPLSLSSGTSYPVAVGAGGSGGIQQYGYQGNSSTISTITSLGGGFGGRASTAGGTGGSGGGGSGRGQVTGFVGIAGAGETNQGYAGGNGAGASTTTQQTGGGGGGAGGIGTAGIVGTGGNGGAGVAISTFASATATGVSNYYAGGGAGPVYTPGTNGSAGSGGGGAVGQSATANTGSGGGGAIGGSTTGGNGASGIVIVRYSIA